MSASMTKATHCTGSLEGPSEFLTPSTDGYVSSDEPCMEGRLLPLATQNATKPVKATAVAMWLTDTNLERGPVPSA